MPITAEGAALIGIGVTNLSVLLKIFYDNRKNGKSKDGNGKFCAFHTGIESRLSTVETEKKGLSKELGTLHTENREEHGKIFSEIKGLTVAVSVACEAAKSAAAIGGRE